MALLLPQWIGGHSALHSHGVQAARIENLWWLMFWVCSAVFVLVMVALGIAITRKRPHRAPARPHPARVAAADEPGGGRRGRADHLTLFVLLFASVSTGRAIASLGAPQGDGDQGDRPSVVVGGGVPGPDADAGWSRTANEIHIPAGRPVLIQLSSADVIHSFWVPSLHGKRDLIPGHDAAIWIEADRPGVYRGFCAEFCGHQHAHMGLPGDRRPAGPLRRLVRRPAPDPAAAGRPARASTGGRSSSPAPCALCHTIQGTQAGGKLGPDLTHLASRRTLAAATLPNTRGNLGGWIVDPQSLKPGSQMPANSLAAG